ncbi:hypothetical protein Gpo141_00008632 [Globisporangium polare]
MDIDPYKCLLSSASREHLKRQAELRDRFVGNVFLPAIHPPSQGPTAAAGATSPLRHLKVIEQCIMAENKREEQLAKCRSDSEKRFWTRKFHTQRNRERKLIQALMLGTTIDAELHIADANVEDSRTATVSRAPLQASVSRMTTGITAKVPSEDRVFYKAKLTGGVPNTKPHLRKKFNLPDCQGSPNKVKPYYPRPGKLIETAPVHRKSLTGDQTTASSQFVEKKKTGNGSPPSHRQTRSATPLHVSPSKPKAAEPPPPVNHPPHLSRSPLKQHRIGPSNATNDGHSPKKKHVKPATKAPGLRPSKMELETHEDDKLLLVKDESVLSFAGPTSFLETQQIAIAALEEKSSPMKGSVSSEKNAVEPGNSWAPLSARDGDEDEHENGTTSMRTKTGRPHSSPCYRTEPLHDASDMSISHSHSTAAVTPTEVLKIVGSEESRRVQTAPAVSVVADQKTVATSEAADQTAPDDEEEEWESYDEVAEDATSTPLDTNTSSDGEEKVPDEQSGAVLEDLRGAGIEDDLHVEELGFDEPEVSSQQQSAIVESAVVLPDDDQMMSNTAHAEEDLDLDEQAEMEIAEVLFDLIDQIAGDDLVTISAPPVAFGNVGAATTGSLTTSSIHIQSAFRGHQARRAFRMALYQEALSCGVLGAMPGSFQGKSGWYQDPKSLMAYYFTVIPDTGEWKQKLVIRCSRLILTSYEMHEEILSKVFISP